jgi:hypothetical protein
MQVVLNIQDENVAEVAAALNYVPNPCDPNYPSAETHLQMAVENWVRQSWMNYRAQLAAKAEMSRAINL